CAGRRPLTAARCPPPAALGGLRIRAPRPGVDVQNAKVIGAAWSYRAHGERKMRVESTGNLPTVSCAAVDLGASSCRVFVARTAGDRVSPRAAPRPATPPF